MQTIHDAHNQLLLKGAFEKTLKFAISASLGVLVTGMLLFFMWSLIAMAPPTVIDNPPKVIEIVMPEKRDIDTELEQISPKPVDPEVPPVVPEFQQSFENNNDLALLIPPPAGPDVIDVDKGFSSGAAMPIVRVAPQYPRRQLQRGIEGFVDLVFDIGPGGRTENIRVVYGEPEGVFDSASIRALKKWKYKPAMEDGVGKVQKNQTTRIKFELAKG